MADLEKLRADIEAAKVVAMRNFKRDWGTDKVSDVVDVLRVTIPQSKSPADAARKALTLIKTA